MPPHRASTSVRRSATTRCSVAARRFATGLRARLGRAVVAAYLLALFLPGPGLWLRSPHAPAHGPAVHATPVLLGVVLFAAGYKFPLAALSPLLARPRPLLAALALHAALPLALIPLVALLLRAGSDQDHGSGITTALILIVTMPVASGATVWATKDTADQPTIVAAVLLTTLSSPLTTPLVTGLLAPLVEGPHTRTLQVAGAAAGGGFALGAIVLPCLLGTAARTLLATAAAERLGILVEPVALVASLLTTYANASGALGACLQRPRPLLLCAAVATAALLCAASFLLGRLASTALRLDHPTRSSLTLISGMNNSSAGAALLTAAAPDKPHLLMPVLAYGLLQKTAANLALRGAR
ncbi:sodium-dependent transporter [Streptomyces sp. NPDC001941]|uniref:sodium-dependent transporter n=1 Tax=Streptomyces sp. NPDC001941 TaxID=3154659 RepID=UPI003320DABE